jgi:hypothetical protein
VRRRSKRGVKREGQVGCRGSERERVSEEREEETDGIPTTNSFLKVKREPRPRRALTQYIKCMTAAFWSKNVVCMFCLHFYSKTPQQSYTSMLRPGLATDYRATKDPL